MGIAGVPAKLIDFEEARRYVNFHDLRTWFAPWEIQTRASHLFLNAESGLTEQFGGSRGAGQLSPTMIHYLLVSFATG